MYDIFDLLAPRVYVVSEKRYEELQAKRREEERETLVARKDRLLKEVEKIDKTLDELESLVT